MIRNISEKSLTDVADKVEPRFGLEQGFRGLNRKISALTEDKNHLNLGGDNELLVVRKVNILQKKNFIDEYRSQRDVQVLSSDINIVLDSKNTILTELISDMIKMTKNNLLSKNDLKQHVFAIENQLLSNTMQGISFPDDDECSFNQTWLCAYHALPGIDRRIVSIARMADPTNFGTTSRNIKFLILIITPVKEKVTKSAEEVAHTFATLFTDLYFRLDLINARTEEEFVQVMQNRAQRLSRKSVTDIDVLETIKNKYNKSERRWKLTFGEGLVENFKRRLGFYWSDIRDGFVGSKTMHKTVATTVSLYLAILLPCIAFGVRDSNNTKGQIDAKRALIGQTIGGLVFALFGGQPLVVIMTTAPLCLYTKVVFDISEGLGVDFYDMFACTGLWNALFVILYALFDVSYLMKWCTRSTEEIFGLFSFFAFLIDPIKDCIINFQKFYCIGTGDGCDGCAKENSVLFLMLMLFTVLLAITLYDFNRSPLLTQNLREIISDYALPVAVVAISFVGSYLFRDINAEKFEVKQDFQFEVISMKSLTVEAVFISMALGFGLSLLFFMDQNISAALVNNPNNKLKKGDAYHWDLFVVGILNVFLSIVGLPWMNGMLPHSPIHARSLADIEQTVDANGRVTDIVVRGRETRVTGVTTHVLIGVSLLLIPYLLDFIPVSVLNGLFLYCAVAVLRDNSLFDRILLFVTEQSSYPPNHYIRRCPQRVIHGFTVLQLIQTVILCFFAFCIWPYVQMAYPVIIAILIPIRAKVIPLFINKEYVEAIDSYH